MPGFTKTVHFAAPKERVFDALTDLDQVAERISGIKAIEMLTEGPVGRGTRFRETRVMFGKEATEDLEFVEFDAPNTCTVGCTSCGAEMHSRFTLSASPRGGTELELKMTARPVTFGAKLMSPLSVLFMGSFKKAMVRDLEDLRPYIEGDAEIMSSGAVAGQPG